MVAEQRSSHPVWQDCTLGRAESWQAQHRSVCSAGAAHSCILAADAATLPSAQKAGLPSPERHQFGQAVAQPLRFAADAPRRLCAGVGTHLLPQGSKAYSRPSAQSCNLAVPQTCPEQDAHLLLRAGAGRRRGRLSEHISRRRLGGEDSCEARLRWLAPCPLLRLGPAPSCPAQGLCAPAQQAGQVRLGRGHQSFKLDELGRLRAASQAASLSAAAAEPCPVLPSPGVVRTCTECSVRSSSHKSAESDQNTT